MGALGPDPGVLPGMSDRSAYMPFTYVTEDDPLLLSILQEGAFNIIIGNPPYITPKDKALNQVYQSKYANVCKGKYALTVPFMALFFSLTRNNEPSGWTSKITSNSFMKREFGTRLVEYLSNLDLRLVADTSGAYIPGHGTPTVIVVGRNQAPCSQIVRTVLGVRTEPGRPVEASKGLVWTSIVDHIDTPGWDDSWVTIADLDRSLLANHPWSLTGGGTVQLNQAIQLAARFRIGEIARRVGVFGIMGADEAMILEESFLLRRELEQTNVRPLVVGEQVRDFSLSEGRLAWFPYDEHHQLRPLAAASSWERYLWPMRTELGNRSTFSGGTYISDGRPWYEWHQLPKDSDASNWSLTFPFVATHNHFVLVRDNKAFKQTAPVIKLPADATRRSTSACWEY